MADLTPDQQAFVEAFKKYGVPVTQDNKGVLTLHLPGWFSSKNVDLQSFTEERIGTRIRTPLSTDPRIKEDFDKVADQIVDFTHYVPGDTDLKVLPSAFLNSPPNAKWDLVAKGFCTPIGIEPVKQQAQVQQQELTPAQQQAIINQFNPLAVPAAHATHSAAAAPSSAAHPVTTKATSPSATGKIDTFGEIQAAFGKDNIAAYGFQTGSDGHTHYYLNLKDDSKLALYAENPDGKYTHVLKLGPDGNVLSVDEKGIKAGSKDTVTVHNDATTEQYTNFITAAGGSSTPTMGLAMAGKKMVIDIDSNDLANFPPGALKGEVQKVTAITEVDQVFGKYGRIVAQPDGTYDIQLPRDSLFEKGLRPHAYDSQGRHDATPAQDKAFDDSAGGDSTPPITPKKDDNGYAYLNIDLKDMTSINPRTKKPFTQEELQSELDGILKELAKELGVEKVGSIEAGTKLADGTSLSPYAASAAQLAAAVAAGHVMNHDAQVASIAAARPQQDRGAALG